MSIRAYAPASIGNVSLGFDLLGAALSPVTGELLGDWVEVAESTDFELSCDGRFADRLPQGNNNNIVKHCYDYFQQALVKQGFKPLSVRLHLHKALPIGSGLGSSASSIVATFFALNEYAGKAFSQDQLLLMMGELEGQISGSIHYDNVAPSYLGGMTLMTGENSPVALALPVFDEWYWIVSYSGLSVSTSAARKILPQQYALSDCLSFGRQLSVFVDALHRGDRGLAAQMMTDVIAEPHRKALLPKFDEAKAFISANQGLAFGISGSGPTVFAVADNEQSAAQIKDYLAEHYVQNDDGFSHVCKIDTLGTRLL